MGKPLFAFLPVLGLGISYGDAALVASAILVGIFVLIRGRSDVWKSNFEAERARADLQAEQLAGLTSKLATLEARPDMTETHRRLDLIVEELHKLVEEFRRHDEAERQVWGEIKALIEGAVKR